MGTMSGVGCQLKVTGQVTRVGTTGKKVKLMEGIGCKICKIG